MLSVPARCESVLIRSPAHDPMRSPAGALRPLDLPHSGRSYSAPNWLGQRATHRAGCNEGISEARHVRRPWQVDDVAARSAASRVPDARSRPREPRSRCPRAARLRWPEALSIWVAPTSPWPATCRTAAPGRFQRTQRDDIARRHADGTLDGGSGSITLAGNWTDSGTYSPAPAVFSCLTTRYATASTIGGSATHSTT